MSWNWEHYGFTDNLIYIKQRKGKNAQLVENNKLLGEIAMSECIKQQKQIWGMPNSMLLVAVPVIFVFAAKSDYSKANDCALPNLK